MSKCLVLYGFGFKSPLDERDDETVIDLNLLLPGYREDLASGNLSKQNLDALHRALKPFFRHIIFSQAQHLIVFSEVEQSNSTYFVAATIRRLLPDIRVVAAGAEIDVVSAVARMRSNLIDLIVLEDAVSKLQTTLIETFQNPEQATGAKVYWKNAKGEIRWNGIAPCPPGLQKVLLVLMPAWNNDFLPFGLAHISSALKSADFDVTVLDLNCEFWARMKKRFDNCSEYENLLLWTVEEQYEKEARPFLDETFAELRSALQEGNYAYVGFSVFLTSTIVCREAFQVTREVAPLAKIFCGGPSCDDYFAERGFQNNTLDAAVFGEGEYSAIELLSAWRKNEAHSEPIAGVSLRKMDGSFIRGPSRNLADINNLPAPDYSAFNIYNYETYALPIFFSRGCVAKCTFCSETVYWQKFRAVSHNRVVATIKHAVEEYGIRNFQVNDSLMNGNHQILESIADELIRLDLKINYTGYCRLDKRLTPELLHKLYRSGCRNIAFGLESGSQKVIDLMKKGVQVKNFKRILRDAHAAGISSYTCVIVGFPGENWWDFLKTFMLILSIHRYVSDVNLSVLSFSPDTILYADREKMGIVPNEKRDLWTTKKGRNTHTIRYLRYRILKYLWLRLKKKRVSPTGWDFVYELAR
jgi:radical SAM superfamily enzyme YgiQ (UPF0313 family)